MKVRNIACHSPLIKNERGFEFAPPAAAKLLKTLDLTQPSLHKRANLQQVQDAIPIAEGALGDGENILQNFAKLTRELEKRRAENK